MGALIRAIIYIYSWQNQPAEGAIRTDQPRVVFHVGTTSITFRQNITIQFCSNLLPVEREEAGNPHPCVSVSIRGQIACFLWRPVSFRSLFFGAYPETDLL